MQVFRISGAIMVTALFAAQAVRQAQYIRQLQRAVNLAVRGEDLLD